MKKIAKLILTDNATVTDGQSVVLLTKNPDYVQVIANGTNVGYLAKTVTPNGRLSDAKSIASIIGNQEFPAVVKAEGKGYRIIVNVQEPDKVYYCVGTGNKIVYEAKMQPTKAVNAAVLELKRKAIQAREAANKAATSGAPNAKSLENEAKEAEAMVGKIGTIGLVDLRLFSTAGRLIFMYNESPCCSPESETDPGFEDSKAVAKTRGVNLCSLEELKQVLPERPEDIQKVRCRICSQMENFSWFIEVRVPNDSSEIEPEDIVDIDKFMDSMDGLPEDDKSEVENRISWLSKVAPKLSDNIMGAFLQRLCSHSNIQPFNPTFIDNSEMYVERCVTAILLGMNLRLVGPAGCGKNRLVETLQNLFDVQISDIAFSADTNQDSLLGVPVVTTNNECIDPEKVSGLFNRFLAILAGKNQKLTSTKKTEALEKLAGVMDEDGMVDWMPLVEALKGDTAVIKFQLSDLMVKAQMPALLNFDEVNMAPGYITAMLHSLTDHRRYINVPGYGVVSLNDEAFIVCTMNEEYEGTRTLNRAFRDRFETIRFMPSQTISAVLRSEVPTLSVADAKVMNDVYGRIQKMVPSKMQEDSLSLRAFIRAAKHRASGWPLKRAMGVVIDDVDDIQDRDSIREIVNLLVK